jgi:hypothetical protein
MSVRKAMTVPGRKLTRNPNALGAPESSDHTKVKKRTGTRIKTTAATANAQPGMIRISPRSPALPFPAIEVFVVFIVASN